MHSVFSQTAASWTSRSLEGPARLRSRLSFSYTRHLIPRPLRTGPVDSQIIVNSVAYPVASDQGSLADREPFMARTSRSTVGPWPAWAMHAITAS